MKFFSLIDLGIEKLAKGLLVLSIFSMLFLTILCIVLRWFSITILWIDPLVRYLVFLCAFLGGVLATGRKSHIGIDLLSKIIERKNHHAPIILERIISLVCTGALLWLVYASIEFTKVELQYGKEAFLGIHNGVIVGIIPFGFSLCAYRFFYLFIKSFSPALREKKI